MPNYHKKNNRKSYKHKRVQSGRNDLDLEQRNEFLEKQNKILEMVVQDQKSHIIELHVTIAELAHCVTRHNAEYKVRLEKYNNTNIQR